MPLSPADLSKEQWDYLVSILTTEASSGRLTGINKVGKSYQLWTMTPPAIGVQFRKFVEEPYATTRHLVRTYFDIIIGVQSTNTTASARFGANTPGNLDDAMEMLQPFISDGNGNGISPVLRDPQYRTLGVTNGQPNAMRSQITEISYEWEIEPGEPPNVWAYALITFMAESIVAIT